MKKFTKMFLSCAAVAAVTTAVAASAMAADITGDVTGTFDETAKTVTNLSIGDVTPDEGTAVTFLVYKGEANATTVAADTVKGIDQGTTVQPEKNGLKSDVVAPAEGQGQETYTVKVGYYAGGTFAVKSGTFKLGRALGEEFKFGDVDGNTALGTNGVSAKDASYVLKYATGNTTGVGDAGKKLTIVEAATGVDNVSVAAGDTIRLGDVDGNKALGTNGVSAKDASYVLKYSTGNTTGTGLAGVTVMASAVEE